MRFSRSCGTLVHPTSFPSKYGMGDLGYEAERFIDFLVRTNQTIWQVLPLGPTGYGNSPYASYSAFAGNHYLISLDRLVDKGLLNKDEVEKAELPVMNKAEYEKSYELKERLFKKAAKSFYADMSDEDKENLNSFKKKNSVWLHDYCLFMTCLKANDKQPWNEWDKDLAQRKPKAIAKVEKNQKEEIEYQLWLQFEFFNQWYELKSYANKKGIRVVGDIPIFVDHNSSDVWSNPKYFAVDKQGNRQLVAGVPPDYFSETGQLWGNPLYKWDALEKDNFSWWVDRFRQMFDLYDSIRVDHFRGFDAYWEVKASEETAIKGRWVKGPGKKLFKSIKKELGELPIIAEDLGVMTPEVEELRDSFDFPGMKILQFAFDSDSTNNFLPHNYPQNCVVYTGTHDNDTTIGWYVQAPDVEKHRMREYTKSDGREPEWELVRLGMLSVADQAIFPLQDFMSLGTEHRMNLPGTVGDNWLWRYTNDMLNSVDEGRIKLLAEMGNRVPSANKED
ncbi:4-alpha-glucanotransferase [Rhodohalobacter barkolensis]|uniref:4-alpha-glucanotransferase n=1 Tax=Rhodohalobacter barkolensis TaxID=2053187 RepID=A0A2N0VGZ3_9BACT|nr:4-alpha-glucanotransferase [Rhodohalobacter barkolensis]PKD43451.1 4-alpha-glucanotransferase [Rhodohalobacter barkolensis]